MMRYALFGDPIGQSPSPAMHNAAFAHLGIEARYELRTTTVDDVHQALNEVRAGQWQGANVTTPLKTVIAREVSLRGAAARAGAVNTLLWEDSQLVGHLTDVAGVAEPLREHVIEREIAIVVGAGGAARAAALACEQLSLQVVMVARDATKATHTLRELRMQSSRAYALASAAIPWEEAGVIVQSTPVGRQQEALPVPWERVRANTVAFEMLYLPRHTPFLRRAMKQGCPTVEGWQMLVAQGARSFELWTSQAAPRDVMREAVLRCLRGM